METSKLIRYNINRIIKEKHTTAKRVCEKAGVGKCFTSDIGRRSYMPNVSTLELIANVLEVDLYEFFLPENKIEEDELIKLYCGLSDSMKTAIKEIMKVTQLEENTNGN